MERSVSWAAFEDSPKSRKKEKGEINLIFYNVARNTFIKPYTR